MGDIWTISDEARALVRHAIAEYIAAAGEPGFSFYPSIMWSTGGLDSKPGAANASLPPHYALGFIAKQDIDGHGFVAINDDVFGFIAFRPSVMDTTSRKRVVDYQAGEIVAK